MEPGLIEIECQACDGTGQCQHCAGWGQDTDGVECPYCNGGSGKCVACSGDGTVFVLGDDDMDDGGY